MAARKPRTSATGLLTDEHRVKIQNANILNALVEHTLGKRPMQNTQVQAGIALLRKIMPDLASVENKGEQAQFVINVPTPMATDDWKARYAPQVLTLPQEAANTVALTTTAH